MYILHVKIYRGEMSRFQVRGPMAHVMVSWVLQLVDSQDILEVRKAQVHVRVQELANICTHIITIAIGESRLQAFECIHTRSHTHKRTHTNTYTHTHTHTHTHKHTPTQTHSHAHTHTHTHAHTHTRTHTHTNTHTHTHKHTRTQVTNT